MGSWEMTVRRLSGTPSPTRGLEIDADFSVERGDPSFLPVAVEYFGSLKPPTGDHGIISWRPAVAFIFTSFWPHSKRETAHLRLPLDGHALQLIEDKRLGGGPLRLELVCDLYGTPSQENQRPHEQCSVRHDIPSEQWRAALELIGYEQYEAFELPLHPLRSHDSLAQGVAILRDARKQFADGNWRGATVDSRRALEAAASIAAEEAGNDVLSKKRWDDLFTGACPGEHQEPRRVALHGLSTALVELRNAAAHGGYVRFQTERRDAELMLTVATAVFRFLGESLADRK